MSSTSGRIQHSMIQYKNMRFLITDKPNDATLSHYIEELKARHVSDVVRVCESTYSSTRLSAAGITCHDWVFDDGIEH
jgi:protein tyrosine phosphatase type 4A